MLSALCLDGARAAGLATVATAYLFVKYLLVNLSGVSNFSVGLWLKALHVQCASCVPIDDDPFQEQLSTVVFSRVSYLRSRGGCCGDSQLHP